MLPLQGSPKGSEPNGVMTVFGRFGRRHSVKLRQIGGRSRGMTGFHFGWAVSPVCCGSGYHMLPLQGSPKGSEPTGVMTVFGRFGRRHSVKLRY